MRLTADRADNTDEEDNSRRVTTSGPNEPKFLLNGFCLFNPCEFVLAEP